MNKSQRIAYINNIMPNKPESLPKEVVDHIIDLMNGAHTATLLRFAHAYGKMTDAREAKLTYMNVVGMQLALTLKDGTESTLNIKFKPPLSGAEETHSRIAEMDMQAKRMLK